MVFVCYSHKNVKAREQVQNHVHSSLPIWVAHGLLGSRHRSWGLWKKVILAFLEKATVAVTARHGGVFRFKNSSARSNCHTSSRTQGGKPHDHLGTCFPSLHEETPLGALQAALPAGKTIREMPKGERDAAWKKVCQRVKEALIARERPAINTALEGTAVLRRVENLQVLCRSATRRTEVFIRADNSAEWYHQGPILAGKMKLTCHFGAIRQTKNWFSYQSYHHRRTHSASARQADETISEGAHRICRVHVIRT